MQIIPDTKSAIEVAIGLAIASVVRNAIDRAIPVEPQPIGSFLIANGDDARVHTAPVVLQHVQLLKHVLFA